MNPSRSAFLIYYVVMGLIYTGMGVAILVFKERFSELGVAANIMGGAAIAYGIFRLYRAFLDFQKARREGGNSHRSRSDLGL